MKIFRRPFSKSNTVFEVKFFTVIFVLLGLVVLPNTEFTILGFLFLVVVCFCVMHIFISQLYYIILTDTTLIIQNRVYSFWRKEVRYIDIAKVRIKWHGDKSYPYMKIITRKPSGISWRYTIDLVDPQDYEAIVKDIEAKGVTVETQGIDVYARIFKDEDKSK